MSKSGFVYIMTTAVDGIIKIGRSENWKNRCSGLEENGYKNMNCLKTYFVVKVNDMESVEKTMHDAFDKGQVINSKGIKTELFVADKDKAKNALAQMGEQIYPETTKKLKSTSSDSEIKNAYNKFFNEDTTL